MNKAKVSSLMDGKKFLQSSFQLEQDVLKSKLELSRTAITHDGVMGEVNERHFINFLRKYLPNRYAIDSAIVIDSNGSTSDQIDIVIYDKQYTPTFLSQQGHHYITAEAVYAIFEVKPTINKKYLTYAADKAASVRKLERTSGPIVHAGGSYPAKPLFSIVSGIIAPDISWADGFSSKSFLQLLPEPKDSRLLNCGLALSNGSFDDFNDSIEIGPKTNSLSYFLFRLLKKLQDLGTVPAVDWNKYADVFSEEDDSK